MADELVDIVNEQDMVIAQALKSDAHTKGFLHRTVIAEVLDSEGNWTLVKQAQDRQDPGQFVSPVGGHVQAGETVEAALKREAFEEMGLTDFSYRFIGKAIFNRYVNNRQENHFFILFEITTNQPPRLNHESVSFEKFSPETLAVTLKNEPERFGAAFHFVASNFFEKQFNIVR